MEIYVANYLSGACAPALLLDDAQTAVHRPVGGWFLHQNGVQNGPKMGPKWLSGGLLELLGLLKASWSGLGGLLGQSGTPLGRSWSELGSLLDALGRSWGGLGGVLRAKRLPKRSPGGSNIEFRR